MNPETIPETSPESPEPEQIQPGIGGRKRAPGEKRVSKPRSYKGTGRPSVLRASMIPRIVSLSARGFSDREIAEAIGVPVNTFYGWKRDSLQVATALEHGREKASDKVERALMRRALGWSGPDEKVLRDGTVIKHRQHHPPETTAAMDWLTNRRPRDWKRRMENSGGGVTVQILSPIITQALAESPADSPPQPAQITEEKP